MHYLITGGAGFIGSHLADRLLAGGHEVTALDDLSSGRRDNGAHLHDNSKFSFVRGSVLDAAAVDPLVARCDRVFHLAAAVGVQLVCEHPVAGIETNIIGTSVVLKSAADHDKKILITSSSEFYGCSTNNVFNEDDNILISPPTMLRFGYAASKAVDEFLAMAYHYERGLPTIVVRLFNTVGPRQTGLYGMVIPRLIDQALAGDPLTVYGDGTQRRCFTAVADTVEALVRLSDCDGAYGEVVNVGSENEIAIGDPAQEIARKTESDSEIRTIPFEEVFGPRFQDMERRYPDTHKLKTLTGFIPKKTLDAILDQAIQYAREQKK